MSTTISTLNELIKTLKDGQEGFRAAASDVDSSELKTLFGELSLQRSKFAGELQVLAHSLGEKDPANAGSTAGALHRSWIDLKAALVKQDIHAVLAECERGEDVAVAAYRRALEESDHDGNVLEVLERQYRDVQAAHSHVKSLRDATTHSRTEVEDATVPSARENPGGMVEKAPFGNS